MPNLSFSVIARSPDKSEHTDPLVERFTRQYNVPVQVQYLTWSNARQELNRIATYNQGADVSQIGSTWLRDLVDMHAVRAFAPVELRKLGDPTEFVPAAWESTKLQSGATVWAAPWLVDARILFYRRDLLKRAGLDEQTAFATPQALLETLAALQARGVAVPWVVPTQFSWRTLHIVASWVWGNGGDFVSRDGKRVLFMEPAALVGFKQFFSTARYLADEARGLSDAETDALFMQGHAAVNVGGPWIMEMDKELLADVGIASPPGPAFVGGSHLIIWKHTANSRAALRLVEHFVSVAAQRQHGFRGLLPARLAALDTVDIPGREFSRYLEHVLLEGRAFTTPSLWALVEERLGQVLAQIWAEVLALPEITDSALDEIVTQRLGALARRLNMMFV